MPMNIVLLDRLPIITCLDGGEEARWAVLGNTIYITPPELKRMGGKKSVREAVCRDLRRFIADSHSDCRDRLWAIGCPGVVR